MKGKIEAYFSYGNCFRTEAEIFYPENLEELKSILVFCRDNGRKITVGGTFNSFDLQNSGKDIVVSMQRFNAIEYDAKTHTIRVGAGAKWGDIFDVVYENRCALYTCITGTQPSAGGTLSINSNSVWSPANGKEGNHCLGFEILTSDGELLTCSRSENSELFYGAIAGMGMLGFITRITYQLHFVGCHYDIQIWVEDHDNVDDLEQKFDLRKSPNFDDLECLRSQSSLFYSDGGRPKFGMYNRRYRRRKDKRKTSSLLFNAAILASGIVRFFPSLADVLLKSEVGRSSAQRRVLRGLESVKPGLFWAEPDYVWSKYIGKYLKEVGYEPLLYQNSYFIPFGDEKVTLFTKTVYRLLHEYGLKTFMFDVMYLPRDEPFVLSCSRFSEGFYVNMTFMEKTNKEGLKQFYAKLNRLALKLGGRMNLSKNCYVDIEILAQMHAPEMTEFMALKAKYDSLNLLQSNFFDKYFAVFLPQRS